MTRRDLTVGRGERGDEPSTQRAHGSSASAAARTSRAADDHAVGARGRRLGGLLGRRDPEAERDRHVGVGAARARRRRRRPSASASRSPVVPVTETV